jgi:hypothetical protein
MNIQGPLLLLGITATTTVGLGTVAVNTGAVNIDDVSGLLSQTVPAVSGTTAGQGVALALPDSPSATSVSTGPVAADAALETAVDGSATETYAGSGGSTGSGGGSSNNDSTNASGGSNSGNNHGNSSGSSGGSGGYDVDEDEDDVDEVDDEDDVDEVDDEDDDDDDDEDEDENED